MIDHESEQKKKSEQAVKEGLSALSYLREQVEKAKIFIEQSGHENITPDQLDYNVYSTIMTNMNNLKDVIEIQLPIFKERLENTYWIKNWKGKNNE